MAFSWSTSICRRGVARPLGRTLVTTDLHGHPEPVMRAFHQRSWPRRRGPRAHVEAGGVPSSSAAGGAKAKAKASLDQELGHRAALDRFHFGRAGAVHPSL